MSAFGRRNGTGNGNRPSFGVARPMKGPGPAIPDDGGSQFPPIDSVALPTDDGTPDGISGGGGDRGDAMARIDARQAAPMADASSRNEGFENSIHRIKEQVLPRLLERVDPEAAATLRTTARTEQICSARFSASM